MFMRVIVLFFILGILPLPLQASDRGDASETAGVIVAPLLIKDLRKAGFVLYVRHAATDQAISDTDRENLSNCETQRPLSELGRSQARSIGAALDALSIPVGDVFSSPYCRTRDTAMLAFGRVELNDDLKFSLGVGSENSDRQREFLHALLSTKPAAGTNTVIVGHTANLREASGVWPKPDGVTVIFAPDGTGRIRYRAAIHPDSWPLTAAQQ